MHVGEVWAYRARQTDPLVQVVVTRIGVRKLARVLVRFVHDVFEGRQEWVPPARLKVLWTDVGDFEAAERWEHIWERGIGLGDPRWEAADEIIRLRVKEDLAEFRYREGGAIRIHQVDELARALNLHADVFTSNPDAFYEDGDLVVPWEVAELIVTAAARQAPDPSWLTSSSKTPRRSTNPSMAAAWVHGETPRHMSSRRTARRSTFGDSAPP